MPGGGVAGGGVAGGGSPEPLSHTTSQSTPSTSRNACWTTSALRDSANRLASGAESWLSTRT